MADPPFTPLLAQILSANAAHTATITNAVVDSLTEQVETLTATITAIRQEILDVLDGDYMPTPDAIARRLYPSDETVDAHRDRSS